MNHPMQPLYKDKNGDIRFHANGIIKRLASERLIDLCDIVSWPHCYSGITQDDIDQFWQLIGYEIGGYEECAASDVVSNEAADRAVEAAKLIS